MPHAAAAQMLDLWSLCEDVVVEFGTSGELVLKGRLGTERIDRPDPVVREALRRMELGPVLLANVRARRAADDAEAGAHLVLRPVLRRLSHLVVRTLGMDDLKGPLLSVSPRTQHARFAPVPLPARCRLRMPSEVSLKLEDAGIALESATSPHRVVLHRPEAAWVVGTLAWPVTPDAAAAALPLPPGVTESVLGYLAAAGMAAPVGRAEG
ncbi:NADH oxidase [Streptomyces sp. GC420]|uniref:NADH oxidase n=1 Tax=Streptomyces sp. GC420 TaxID=2697568 RepID=UPI0014151ED6|nr:NADH oxidase [Streptomyces sp. GC420]NBM15589.1 NADH oxidase [Streptomyces sp. GC420]